MADRKTCPKCNGTMTQGRVMRLNEYALGNQYMYMFAPDGESGPTLSKGAAKPDAKSRKPLAAFCCDNCGYTEFYGLAA